MSSIAEEEKEEKNSLQPVKRSLTKKERLTSQKEIRQVFTEKGKKVTLFGCKLLVRQNQLEYSRFAVVLVRKFGNAVERNRAKRIAREVYRNNKNLIVPGNDLIIVFYPGRKDSYKEWEEKFLYLIDKAKVKKS